MDSSKVLDDLGTKDMSLELLLAKVPATRTKRDIEQIYSMMCNNSKTLKFFDKIGDLENEDKIRVDRFNRDMSVHQDRIIRALHSDHQGRVDKQHEVIFHNGGEGQYPREQGDRDEQTGEDRQHSLRNFVPGISLHDASSFASKHDQTRNLDYLERI